MEEIVCIEFELMKNIYCEPKESFRHFANQSFAKYHQLILSGT
jgi:hypothetical protein